MLAIELCGLRFQERASLQQSFDHTEEIIATDDDVSRSFFPIVVAAAFENSDLGLRFAVAVALQ